MSDIKNDYQGYLVMQLRAVDSYGAWKELAPEELLERAYLVSSGEGEQKPIPFTSEQLVRFQLQACANILEKETGLIPSVVCETGCDGSVKGLVIAGQVVLLQKVFYNTGEFRYRTLDKLLAKGEKVALKILDNCKSVRETASALL